MKSSGAKSRWKHRGRANGKPLVVRGKYQLPPPNARALEQPADLQLIFRAPQVADYWQGDAPGKVTGQLQADGNVRVRKGVASGQLDLFGQEIAAQRLLVRQLSTQVSIANNVAYLNDLTATLTEKDYVAQRQCSSKSRSLFRDLAFTCRALGLQACS